LLLNRDRILADERIDGRPQQRADRLIEPPRDFNAGRGRRFEAESLDLFNDEGQENVAQDFVFVKQLMDRRLLLVS
jgi:hypothetical protein